jgi:hypothetical protein
MKTMYRKIFGTVTVALTFFLVMLFISSTSFAEQCVDNGDGTVTDNNIGLMWQQGLSAGEWTRAMHTADIKIGGHSDWRLPSKGELINLYNSSCKSMMVVRNEGYWSSAPYKTASAWVVDFSNGSMRYEMVYKYHFIRYVRNSR